MEYKEQAENGRGALLFYFIKDNQSPLQIPTAWRQAFCSALPARRLTPGTWTSLRFHRAADSQPRRNPCLGRVGLTTAGFPR